MHIFQYMDKIFYGISKSTFENPHIISFLNIESYAFYTTLKIQKLLNWTVHMHFLNGPQIQR